MQTVRQLGAVLRQARKRQGLTQSELAQRCGLHQPQVVKAEQGSDMLVSRLGELAQALDYELVLVPRAALRGMQDGAESSNPALVDGMDGAAGRAGARQNGRREAHQEVSPEARREGVPRDYVDVTLKDWAREWPVVPASVFAVIARLMRASQHLERAVGAIAAQSGMHGGELLVLGALRRLGPPYQSTPSDLRKAFWITLPGMTKRLGRLERLGMVERVPSPHDRRASVVRLTARAHALLDASGYHRSPVYDAIIALPQRDRDLLGRLLKRILAQAESVDAGGEADVRKGSGDGGGDTSVSQKKTRQGKEAALDKSRRRVHPDT